MESRHSENISGEKCFLYRSMRFFYLAILLHEHTTSWTRIRTVNGLPQEAFEDAARAIGLGVEEYTICLREGVGFSTAK